MRTFSFLFVFTFLASPVFSQKVGLVLSGGAAKGLAHVGVLKALEENEIPIDYVVGTSMGGIIAGCYAAGMSPERIESIVLSEDFLRWVNGLPEKGFNYYYHRTEANPAFLKVNLSLDSIFNFQFASSLASDVSLNFALAEKMALASAISNNNFDSLFVPLRVVAADVFTQSQVILSSGHLSDALRATQTVPFFYNPIRVDGKYLFDGGVYNNFPVDVVQEHFNPDVVIGCNVSTKVFNEYPFERDEELISRSLIYMLLDKSDPSAVPPTGVYIQPNLSGYTSFDFARVKSLIDSGYVQTMRQMDEIRRKVARRMSCDSLAEKRNAFHARNPPLKFSALRFNGFNAKQQAYIRRIFRVKRHNPKPFYLDRVKNGYFKMVSEEYFNNVYPNICYDSAVGDFNLMLTRRPQKNLQVEFGGVIATRDISNIFLGINFFNFSNHLLHLYGGFHTGNFYKSATFRARADFPLQFFVEPELGFDIWNYLEGDDLLRVRRTHSVLRRVDNKFNIHVGLPVGRQFRSMLSFGGFDNIDRYANSNIFVSADTLDELRLAGLKAQWTLSSNTLNRKQYASAGHAYAFTAQFYRVREGFYPGSTSLETTPAFADHQWFRVKASIEQYFDAGWYRPGYLLEAVVSNQPFFQNYFGTMVNTPAFQPLQDSPTLVLRNFRAFNYLAGGIRNVFAIRNRLDFRIEAFAFKPIEHLREAPDQEAMTVSDIRSFYFTGTAGMVLHAPLGPISLSLNYYDDEQHRFGALLHVGFLLFNKHSMQ